MATQMTSARRGVATDEMKKVAKDACVCVGAEPSDEEINRIASDPRFQLGLMDIIANESPEISI